MLISSLSILVLRSKISLIWPMKRGRLQNTNGIASVINPILATALGAVLPEGTEQSALVGILREFQKVPWLFHRD
jgi:hypothetical protein